MVGHPNKVHQPMSSPPANQSPSETLRSSAADDSDPPPSESTVLSSPSAFSLQTSRLAANLLRSATDGMKLKRVGSTPGQASSDPVVHVSFQQS